MTMVIVHPFIKSGNKAVGNISTIPRIGDRVMCGFEPPPKVRDVIWDFSEEKVYIVLE